jgi:Fic family protein
MKRMKTAEIESLILQLLTAQPEVSIRTIASAAGLSPDDETKRKAIQRALISLVEQNSIIPKGAGRSRVYVLTATEKAKVTESEETGNGNYFAGITLSPESEKLLKSVSKPIETRSPVGFDRTFLESYEPNVTFYLSAEQRGNLLSIGRVEATQRPAGTYARNILDRLLIDLSWNSSRLEGNTYSLLETKRLIELGETVTGKDASEAQMILNHKAAIEYIVETSEEDQMTSHEVCSIHALLSENLLGDPAASGRIRNIAVGIGGSTYIPLENPHVLRECFQLFVEKINHIEDPFEQSFFSLVHLSYLQAFEDVNKRTARLVANIPLVKQNLKPLSFTDVNRDAYVTALLAVYETNNISLLRDLYIWAYRRSSQRYTAIQQAMGEPNLLKLKYRMEIQEIVRTIILEKTEGVDVAKEIQKLTDAKDFPEPERREIINLIETEIMSLHEGSVARFKVRPSEYHAWKALQ